MWERYQFAELMDNYQRYLNSRQVRPQKDGTLHP